MTFHLILSLVLPFALAVREPQSLLTQADPRTILEDFLTNGKYSEESHSKALEAVSHLNPETFLSAALKNQTNSSACVDSLISLGEDLKNSKSYALSAVDSWGKPESGILQGNMKWYGRYKECLESRDNTNSSSFVPQYCVSISGSVKAKQLQFTSGVCLPDTCSAQELNYYVSKVVPSGYYSLFFCDILTSVWKEKDTVALVLLSFLFLMTLLSTAFDLLLKYQQKGRERSTGYSVLVGHEVVNGNIPLPNALHDVLLSFSLIQNSKLLLRTKQKDGEINCIHGIRFLSMAWVVLGHMFVFGQGYIDNPVYLSDWALNHWSFEVVLNGTFSVDTFFFLGGLLVAYLGMKETERRRGRVNPALMYLLRYIRLTPAYAFCILMASTLWLKLGDGPMFRYAATAIESSCDKYWWTNLLYINNLHPSNLGKECFGHGWYLANDMQFFLLVPMFLFACYKSPKIGIACVSSTLFASILITGVFSSITRQQPFVASGTIPDDTAKFSDFISSLYTMPYTRIGAYLVGFLTGYVLHRHRGKQLYMSKLTVAVGWVASTSTALLIMFGLYSHVHHWTGLQIPVAAFYNAVARPAWSLVIAWIVVACVNGYGGPINTLLSWKAFMPLSRLTFISYLIHPFIVTTTYASSETTQHVSLLSIVLSYLGILTLTHLIAFVIAMLVELPCAALIRAAMKQRRPNSSSSGQNETTAVEGEEADEVEASNKTEAQLLGSADI